MTLSRGRERTCSWTCSRPPRPTPGCTRGEEVAEQVMDAAYELHDLVSACVALRDPDGRP